MDRNICRFYNTKNGCRNGNNCPFTHKKMDQTKKPKCRLYRGPGTCMYGDNCFFRHEDVKSSTKSQPAGDAIASLREDKKTKKTELPTESMEDDKQGDKEKTMDLLTKNLGEDKKGDKTEKMGLSTKKVENIGDTQTGAVGGKPDSKKSKKKSPKSKEKYLSVKMNNKVKDDSTPIKSAKQIVETSAETDTWFDALEDVPQKAGEKAGEDENNNSLSDRGFKIVMLITCGECGLTLHDISRDDDGLDDLQKHYKEMFLKMDKQHLSFLDNDPRFDVPTKCFSCKREFKKVKHLISHVVGKIKSKKNDWKDHDEWLEMMLDPFWDRDNGISDEDEFMDSLLMWLVDSYESQYSYSDTDDDDDDDSDDDDEEDYDYGDDSDASVEMSSMKTMFGLMAVRKQPKKEGSHDDKDSDGFIPFHKFGIEKDEADEIESQGGIIPIPPEALALLKGGKTSK